MAQFLMFSCFEAAVVLLLYMLYTFTWYQLLALFIAMKILFGLVFELFFSFLLIS